MKIIDKIINRNVCSRFEKPLYIDIETTGLSPDRAHTYLVGVCYETAPGSWHFRQWLAENPLEERKLIAEVNRFASEFETLIHYNGDRFDLPWLHQKAVEFGLDSVFMDRCSVDLFRILRPLRHLFAMEHCHQKDFEFLLGVRREDRYDGGRLIEVYHNYVRTGSPELEHLLLIHNEEDVLNMANLTCLLPYSALLDSRCSFLRSMKDIRITEDRVLLQFETVESFPIPVSFGTEALRVSLRDDVLRISASLIRDTLRYYLAPVRDYFYLPEEDMAIHRSVASFVDPSHRIKATPETCYVKKQGVFLRIPAICGEELQALSAGSGCSDETFRRFSRSRGADPCIEWREDLPISFWESCIRHSMP